MLVGRSSLSSLACFLSRSFLPFPRCCFVLCPALGEIASRHPFLVGCGPVEPFAPGTALGLARVEESWVFGWLAFPLFVFSACGPFAVWLSCGGPRWSQGPLAPTAVEGWALDRPGSCLGFCFCAGLARNELDEDFLPVLGRRHAPGFYERDYYLGAALWDYILRFSFHATRSHTHLPCDHTTPACVEWFFGCLFGGPGGRGGSPTADRQGEVSPGLRFWFGWVLRLLLPLRSYGLRRFPLYLLRRYTKVPLRGLRRYTLLTMPTKVQLRPRLAASE